MNQILVITGSARKGGNTDLLADALVSGAAEAGNTAQKLALRGREIHPCIDCQSCFHNGGRCVYDDGMTELYAALAEADLVVLATPVYFYGCSAVMKAMLDRFHNPIRDTFHITGAALLAACADGPEAFEPLLAMYHANLNYLRIDDLGTVTVPNTEAKGAVSGNASALDAARSLGRKLGAR